ncbi:MAG: 23S rRNA (pseudouridine(1915)-N(3))-methyltransferase RlmH [Deltaproteobacteria bacterium]|nr:23S rRNA (pseudouridine(1915)-N(3))-methyltransferase RlmH [Deltaproteobacteria bacterium]
MRLQMLLVGKTRNLTYHQEISEYHKRLNRYLGCDVKELREEKPGRKETPEAFCRRQGPRLVEEFNKPAGLKILLDERGRSLSSHEFALFMQGALQGGHQSLVFFCGGPFGYAPALRETADHLISLSPMTFPHEVARLLLFEQLYRSMTIINKEPYHY